MFYCRLEILLDKFNQHIPAQLTSWQRLVVNLAPQKISEMILLNIADKDVAQYKQESENQLQRNFTTERHSFISVPDCIEQNVQRHSFYRSQKFWAKTLLQC